MAKIYYVGDWAVLTGPVFAETPFYHSVKGLDIFNYGVWLKKALESSGEHEVESVPTWDFYNKLGPGDYEKILADFDVFIFTPRLVVAKIRLPHLRQVRPLICILSAPVHEAAH